MVVLYGVFGPVNTKGQPTVVVEESPNDRSQSENTNTTLVNKVINNSFHINKIIPLLYFPRTVYWCPKKRFI